MPDTLAQNISARLEELKLTPAGASRAAGLDLSFIRDLLRGKKVSISTINLNKLAKALECQPGDLTDAAEEVGIPPNRIAEHRNAASMSQQALAEAVGTHWVTISKLERGIMNLTLKWMSKLAPALKVSPSDLMPVAFKTTGQRIKGARRHMSLSQAELADLSTVSPADVAQWELDQTKPSSKNLAAVAVILDVAHEWLATGRGAMSPDGGASTFGGRFRMALDAATTSQSAVARDLEITRQAVSAWASDTKPPSADHLPKIAALLECDVDWLRTGRGAMSPANSQRDMMPRQQTNTTANTIELRIMVDNPGTLDSLSAFTVLATDFRDDVAKTFDIVRSDLIIGAVKLPLRKP